MWFVLKGGGLVLTSLQADEKKNVKFHLHLYNRKETGRAAHVHIVVVIIILISPSLLSSADTISIFPTFFKYHVA